MSSALQAKRQEGTWAVVMACAVLPSDGNVGGGNQMNEDTLKGQWMQLKGKIREQWGKLTDDDVDQIQGRSEQLVGKLQNRYGIARDEAQRQVDAWMQNTPTQSPLR
jgi:uncharacterized protein YjbJ (UPF0337 family)